MEKQKSQLAPEQDALEHIVACRDKPFLEERFIDSFKERGVFTHETIKPSMFVVEYRGKIFGHKNTRPRRKCGDTLTNYVYEFSWKGARWCIDASKEDKTLGRLVNDDHINPNCEMKRIEYEGTPHLCLFAVREIYPGEEITYNYGDSSYPWRSKAFCEGSSASNTDLHTTSSTPTNKKFEEASSNEGSCSDDDDDELPDSGSNSGSDGDYKPDEKVLGSDEESSDDDNLANEDTEKPEPSSYSRRNYCYVCGKGMTKIARHLFIHADEEPDITKVLALPKKSKERKRLLNDLRNRGNYKHNQEVLRTNSGDLKPKRHPKNSSLNGKTYVHCLHCKGMFCRKEIWRHMARCPKKNADSAKPGKARESESDLSESLWYEKYPSEMQKMLLKMKQDEIAFAVNNDHLLIQWAQYLVGKYADNRKMHQYFSKKLRQMGRLLLTLYEKSIFSFEDALKPQNFYKVVEAVRHNAGFDEKKKSYKNPSIALKLVQSLKQIANVVLKGSDNGEEMVRSTKKFLTMCAEEWCDLVSHNAHTSKYKRQINRPSTIPFTHDVQAFYKHLETISASATETMKKYESPQVYNALCRVTLAQVSVLNKGTPEVSKVTLKSFQEREETTQVLSKHFIRINIPSKTGQNVAVLLTSELVNAITLLVSKRKSCGVHKDNLFLFAKPDGSASSFYYGGGCLKSFSNLCHAKNPEYLRSTYFQKHITRVFQILNLENDELDHLSKLLGLTIRTERDYYRLPEAAEELAKIAKLLLAMEKGSFERVKGNSLDEIEIEDQLEPDVEQVYSKYCDAEEDKESDALPQQSDDVDQQVSHPDPEQDALEHIKASKDKAFLEGICIDPFKGRGLFTHESIEPSTFVVEYRGKCFTREDSQKNKCGDSLNKYLFDFSWKGTNWCIDASSDDGSLGRLVNDDHISPNCEVKKIVCEGKPHLCLFAIKKIFAGEEITYNYGDSSCPWRSTNSSGKQKTSQRDGNAAASSAKNIRGEDLSSAESGCDDTGDVFDDDQRSDDDLTSNNNKLDLKKKNPDFAEAHSSEQQPIDDSFIQQEDETHQEEKPSYTNRNYCYICGKAQSKISRHLFTHRHEDAEIAEIFALRRNSKERKSRLEKLRDKGNCKHNEEVLKTRRGELKVRKRQLNRATAARTFVPCIYCKVMFGRTTIWHHLQKCSLKNISKPPKGVGPKILTVVAATVTDSQEIPSDVKELVQTLKEDKVTSVVSKDSYILQLAQCLCHESKGKKRRYEYVRTKLRQMGRLLLLLKEKAVGSFEEAMKPANYSKVVEAVRKLTGFSEEGKSCDTPSLLLKLVKSLEVIGGIKYARAVKEDDQERMQEAETFLALCAKEWSGFTDSDVKANSVSAIPFTHDVQLVYQHLEKTAASGVQTLTTYESPPVYNALLRVTFAQLSVLNKYAPDISNITLQSFIERQETELHEDAIGCQSQLEQILRKRFVTIQVTSRRDKKCRGKKCALVLSPELLTAITLLVSKREVCGVNKKNPFLFARPNGVYTSVYRGQKCINILMDWSGAKNPQTLRSPFFFKHMARIFHILSLSNSELDQLSKLLERNIRTDWEYYRMPEAAGDIVKILQLLSAMEKGSFERFEGKTLEEIEVEDELQPEMEENNPETSDGEEDNLEAQSSLHPSDTGNETNTTQDATCKGVSFSKDSSSTKKQASPLKKPGRGRTEKWDSEGEEAELSDENHDEVNSEREDRTEDVPVKRAKETPTQSKEETAICFSDDDDDMHVDFDIDIDTDEDVRNEGNNEDGHSADSATATPMRTDMKGTTNQNTDISEGDKEEDSPDEDCGDVEDTMESDIENDVDEEDQETRGEQMDRMDVDSSSSDAMLSTEKKKKLSAAVTGMREVKILIPKLDIEKVKAPVHISELSSLFSKWPVKDQLVWNDDNKRKTSTHINNKPSDAKDVEMTCSNCKKTMMKGQTAYQKKGFTDVFCSKICLFEKFPVNKPASKTCHYCLKEITQLLNLIMAVVDIKGTMKDFCGLTCLTTFKFNTVSTQSLCSTCNKSCTTTLELILNEVVHKFCSDSCLAGFRRDNVALCENCDSPCHKKLMLKLEEDTKTFCSGACVEEYKKNINTAHSCTMCHTSVPVSRMFVYKTSEDTVELFCHRPCATSYKLGCEIIHKLQETKGSAQKKKNKRSKQNSNTEDVNVGSDSTANENDASPAAASDTTPTPITADSRVSCCNCGKELQEGETIYQLKSSQEFFCSASCVSERHNITVAVKSCYNCFQEIKRPQNIISAPVDNSGTIKELCSETCLASVQSKRRMTASKPSPTLGPRSECRMCVRYCYCKFKLTLDGVVHRLCSNSCFISYHKVNNLPLLMCEVCSSVDLPMRLTLKMWDGSKNVCSEKCLIKFKEKVQTPELCPMCQTFHQLSDMVENKNEDGSLNFFCSNRCMMVYKVPSFTASEKSKPSPEEEDDIKEVKPPLPKLDCTKVKEEPIDDEYKQNLPPLVSTQDVKEEPNVAQEDLKIGSVFSLTGDPTPAAPTLTRMDLPASCSSCKEVLRNGETVYQRKGHTDVFCSTSCLMKFYQMKAAKKTCHFCLEVITQPQDAVQAQLDDEETVKDFCSQSCLSSFNYKTFVSTKIPIVPVGSHSQCSICGRYCISKHEVIQQDTVHKICSESCFRRFRNMNNLSISQNNQSPCSTPHTLKMEDGNRKLCSEKCLAQCKEKSQAQQPCSMCSTSNQVSEIVKNNNSDNTVENCCTNSCVMESKPVSATAAAKSSPVIANVVSLASALSRHSSSSTARQGSLPDIHTKVVGHASIQTAPKEVKNKSTLCTPLVHNKGVSCTTQTVDKEAQTDKFFPKVIVLPVPVPVYVPLPMNMYSQYTPKPVGLPLPLPVPMFIPVTSAGPEPQVKTGDERIQPETLEEKLEAQMETKQDDRNEREDEQEAREVTKGGGGEETKAYTEHTRSCCHDVNKDLDSLNIQESSSSDSNLRSHSRPHPHMKPPPVSDSNMPSEPQPELPQPTPPHPHSSQSPAPSPLPSQQSLVKAHNKNKDRKLKLSKAAKEDTAPQDVSKGTSRRPRKLKIQRGLEAWKRWIHRRESQTNMDPGSPHAVKLKENILHCSASELNDGLCLFIREVKRSNGEPYSSDSLFYLCLSIQQYLFDSGRMENIFSDQIYSKFSTEFTNILKHQKFSVTARGYVHSRVEEEYLWDCKQLGAYSPIVLLNTLLFFCCKYFGLTTVEQNRQLSFSQVILCTKTNPNNIRTTFLRFHPSVSMNESDGVPAKKRKKNVNKEEILEVMENTENPLRCPVRLYEFYISKCGELVKQRSDSFYLQPDRCCVPSSDLWFSSTPLDCSIMEAMLERILTVREIEERH